MYAITERAAIVDGVRHVKEVIVYRKAHDADPVNVFDKDQGKQLERGIDLPKASEAQKIYFARDLSGFQPIEKPKAGTKWLIHKMVSPLFDFDQSGFYHTYNIDPANLSVRKGVEIISLKDYVEPLIEIDDGFNIATGSVE